MARHPDGAYTLGGTPDPAGGDRVATVLESIAATSRTAGDDRTRARRPARRRRQVV